MPLSPLSNPPPSRLADLTLWIERLRHMRDLIRQGHDPNLILDIVLTGAERERETLMAVAPIPRTSTKVDTE